jgi:hypothetical protein
MTQGVNTTRQSVGRSRICSSHVGCPVPRARQACRRCPTSPANGTTARAGVAITVLYAGTTAANAALLFAVEPLVSRQLLPLLGGTPAVWNTCLMAFQALLLAGYLYAHLLTTRLIRARAGRRAPRVDRGVVAHAAGRRRPAGTTRGVAAAGWVLVLLTAAVGAPFVLLAAGAPLLHRWFARGAGAHALRALRREQRGQLRRAPGVPARGGAPLGLAAQAGAWSWAYRALGARSPACAWTAARRRPAGRPTLRRATLDDAATRGGRRAVWTPWRSCRRRCCSASRVPQHRRGARAAALGRSARHLPPDVRHRVRRPAARARRPARRGVRHHGSGAGRARRARAHSPLPVVAAAHLAAFARRGAHLPPVPGRPAAGGRAPHRVLPLDRLGGLLGGVFDALVAPAVFRTLASTRWR